MRILVPLPFDIACRAHGRNLRVIHLLDELSASCEITIAAASAQIASNAKEVLSSVQILAAPDSPQRDDARAATLPGPWWVRRVADFFGYDPAVHAWVDRLSSRADVALGFDVASAPYLLQLGQYSARNVPSVCDLIDDPWLTFRNGRWEEQLSTVGVKTGMAVHTVRRRFLPQLDALVAVAPRDAEMLTRTTGRPVHVVPNGVVLPDDVPEAACRELLVVLTGAMSFSPNEQAARYITKVIWPRVRRMVPHARLALVGADPSPRIRALSQEPGVTVTGAVDSVADWLRRARVATAPMLSGTGLKNKVLEACAQGCPVVATSLGSAGIPDGPENGILIADDPAFFAAHIIQLLIEPEMTNRVGQAGARMVRNRFSWPRVAGTLQSILQDCAAGSRAGTTNRSDALTIMPDARVGKEVAIHAAS